MALKKSDVKVGDTTTQVVADNITRTQIVQYAGSSGDYNPLHTDEVFTTKVAGYPSVFAHGMLSMGATGKLLTDYVGDGMLTYYGVRFTYQVWPGDTLTGHGHPRGGRRRPRRPRREHQEPGRHRGHQGLGHGPPRVLTAADLANFPRWRPHAWRVREQFADLPPPVKADLFDRIWVTYAVAP